MVFHLHLHVAVFYFYFFPHFWKLIVFILLTKSDAVVSLLLLHDTQRSNLKYIKVMLMSIKLVRSNKSFGESEDIFLRLVLN